MSPWDSDLPFHCLRQTLVEAAESALHLGLRGVGGARVHSLLLDAEAQARALEQEPLAQEVGAVAAKGESIPDVADVLRLLVWPRDLWARYDEEWSGWR